MASEEGPLVEVPVGEAPKGWRGVGETSRGKSGSSSSGDVVWYRPFALTKRLLGLWLHDASRTRNSADKGFLGWLEGRRVRRSDTKERVGGWQNRKAKVAAAARAEDDCVAVLCLDSGAAEGSGAPTLDSQLRGLLHFTESTEGGKGGAGGFTVRHASRQGLDLSAKLFELAKQPEAVEVRAPLP